MISLKLCLAAEGIIRDADTNGLSIFNMVEGFSSPGFPFFIQRLSFLALWERKTGDAEHSHGTFTLSIGEETLSTLEMNIDFAGMRRNRSIVQLHGLVVPRPGTLRFLIVLDEGVRAEYLLEITTHEPTITQGAGVV